LLWCLSVFLIIVSLIPSTCRLSNAQVEQVLKTTDVFEIPDSHGAIRFSVGGSFENAYLQNGTWSWTNLSLDNSQGSKFNLKASAENSNITISALQLFNTTLGGSARLRYAVEGRGAQSFNLGLNVKGGEWSVILNGVYTGRNNGWTMSPDLTITVTQATDNVTIVYYGFPDSFEGSNGSNENFYQKHSVAILTSVSVLGALIIALLAKWRTSVTKVDTFLPSTETCANKRGRRSENAS
jgi:hypothetical protein